MIRRYVGAFLIVVVELILLMIISMVTQKSPTEVDDAIVSMMVPVLEGVLVIGLLVHYRRQVTVFDIKSLLKGILVYGLPGFLFYMGLLIYSLNWIYSEAITALINQFHEKIPFVIIFNIVVVFSEEMIYRAGITNYLYTSNINMTKKRAFAICIYSGILFGIAHFSLLGSGAEVKQIINTIVIAGLSGFVFSVIYLKTKNIFSVMLLHFVWNMSATVYDAKYKVADRIGRYSEIKVDQKMIYYQVIAVIVMVIWAVIILYKSKTEDLQLNQERKRVKMNG